MKITTLEQLEKLPVGAVVLSCEYPVDNLNDQPTAAFQKRGDGNWYRGARTSWVHPDGFLPATLLIPATITQKQLTTATEALHISLGGEDAKNYIERGGSPLDSDFTAVKAALTALGISVEEEDG